MNDTVQVKLKYTLINQIKSNSHYSDIENIQYNTIHYTVGYKGLLVFE